MSTLRVGTSGFSFEPWKGPFYPADLPSKKMLGYYASRLGTVEINYTFRHFPSSATLAKWAGETPDGFAFSIKAHQRITHTKRLSAPEELVSFVARVTELGDRLGPILVQCPPNLKLDAGRLEALLAAVPPGPRLAFEFRHPSWAEARPRILAAGAASVASDTDEEPFAGEELDEGRFVYLRLRATAYDDAALDRWARRVERALARGTEVFAYFKHEDDGLGPRLAEGLAARVLGAARPSP